MSEEQSGHNTLDDGLQNGYTVKDARADLMLLSTMFNSVNAELLEILRARLTKFFEYSNYKVEVIASLRRDGIIGLTKAAIQFLSGLNDQQSIQIAEINDTTVYPFTQPEAWTKFQLGLTNHLQNLLSRYETDAIGSFADYPSAGEIKELFTDDNQVRVVDLPALTSEQNTGISSGASKWELIEISLATLGLFPFPRKYIQGLLPSESTLQS